MTLEIENILRNVTDIRRQLLSLAKQIETPEQIMIKLEIETLVNDVEHSTRNLEFEITEGPGENEQKTGS